MKKKIKPNKKDFDEIFDNAKEPIDFSGGTVTTGLSQSFKLPPLNIPSWVVAKIDQIATLQANSRAAVVRQLLVEALQHRQA